MAAWLTSKNTQKISIFYIKCDEKRGGTEYFDIFSSRKLPQSIKFIKNLCVRVFNRKTLLAVLMAFVYDMKN